ncbi:adenylate kinase family protein [Desulfurococcus amylolyticus]|uniref:Putative adenylate kinase n=1 Tax=Desulfurococcus amylolyticus DSM 16532 TaxID=768672 RepID=I3XPP9_DESAM|nr:adenylate kinase family protein [Desulfurococcus amylolyticus]AFL65923.1 Adenylate kinase [Desulfurococcus amylolyticus DSM 16532]
MGKIIVVAGVPGTGKTSVSRELASLTGFQLIELGRYALERGLVTGFDDERGSYVIDEDALSREVSMLAGNSEGYIIVSTHYPEILDPSVVEKVFVLRTHPLVLEKRLESRGWDRRKINENVMAEILGVVSYNALTVFGEEKIYEIDTSNTTPGEVAGLVADILSNKAVIPPGIRIDWLSVLSAEELSRFESYE